MKREELTQALRRAASSYIDLLRRLESDGYLKSTDSEQRIVSTILHEMAAYAAALAKRCGFDTRMAVDQAMTVFLPEEETLEAKIRAGVLRRAEEFTGDPDEIPSCYTVVDRFDAMALGYDGAFYKKIGVEAPGRLSEKYIELLQGFGRVIESGEDPEEGEDRKTVSVTDHYEWTDAMKHLVAVRTQAAL